LACRLKLVDPGLLAGRPEQSAYGIMRDAIEGSIVTRICRFRSLERLRTRAAAGSPPITSLVRSLQAVGTDDARGRPWPARGAHSRVHSRRKRRYHSAGNPARLHRTTAQREIALSELDTLLATPLEQSPLYDPARRDSTPRFRAELARIIDGRSCRAMRRYRAFLATEYLARARTAIGVSANPHGIECYRAAIRATTGLAFPLIRCTGSSCDGGRISEGADAGDRAAVVRHEDGRRACSTALRNRGGGGHQT